MWLYLKNIAEIYRNNEADKRIKEKSKVINIAKRINLQNNNIFNMLKY